MTGAIAGDIIGSVYEFDNIKTTDFPLFTNESDYTDDTIMTVAVADWLLNGGDLTKVMQRYGREYPYPTGGYGGRFSGWLREKDPLPYNSWGNGSAMRVSAVGWMFDSLEKTLEVAKETAIVTHNHPEGIKGAQATAAAIYLARTGKSKRDIKQYIETTFSYDLGRTCDEIRPFYRFNESCQGTVPEAIIAFLDSSDFENAIRLAVSLGGDSDTLACITGGIAEAFYGIPEDIEKQVSDKLPGTFQKVIKEFKNK
ncbi:MAG: ADP-ribosylglycohydrolase family protein [Parabacteroides gordonii]|uniref:ADP-ribosylglycohydrolase family protein n=1 Tax=Parabacteroides gordonii TaxID=574930 RepID=UPI003A843DE0